MKLYVLGVVLIATALSCSDRQKSLSGNRSVEGVYVMESKGEFSTAEDTLVVHKIENQTLLFGIERKVGFQWVKEKGRLPKQMKQEKSTAVWNEETGQLREQKHGRAYSFSADGKQLQLGSNVYQKVADQ